MLTVAQALEMVLQNVRPLPAATATLGPDALGLVLAEDIASDLDLPPFDKAMMDGFALRASDLRDGRTELTIIEEIPAGKTPTRTVAAGQASRIMTGAPMPGGADAVVMIERCEIAGQSVRVNEPRPASGMNVLPRGREMRVGETVLRAGTRIRPQELGLLAAVGRTSAKVQPRPSVAILPTGDELVDPSQQPGPGQIRNSNGPMLVGQAARAGATPRFLGIARDEIGHLRSLIAKGLRSDVLLLSGGVSAGKLDLVPGVLAELGVKPLFHKISMKPGKPLLFGVCSPHPPPLSQEERGALVFGLPGNPVASLVCFEVFVRSALRVMRGLPPGPSQVSATLTKDLPYRTDRTLYYPVRLSHSDAGFSAEPLAWFGSPDLRGTMSANAFAVLPEGECTVRPGERIAVLRMEEID
ncbi:MAG TPA: gephyrin-like molybdotransferase Glp [Gemmataceae bacterium]|nr:gephyrin-like molybdotransferase Glp [Gemmataceae bacterium]